MVEVHDERRVIVRLPAALRPSAGGRLQLEVAGETVREVIDALDGLDPGLRFHLCLETGALRPYVNVFVNGTNVRYADGLDTRVPSGATIYIFQSVAGG